MTKELQVKIFQIFYNEETRSLLDPAFIPLDNSENPRPDWSEYWPIRNVLHDTKFDDNDYLGFFSPRFFEKIRLSGKDVIARVQKGDSEVYGFSPAFEQHAFHLNPFEQGERVHAGLTALTEELLPVLGIPLDIRHMVCDRTTTIFSNYFVAKYALWREWLALVEHVFQICEDCNTDLGRRLTESTNHRRTDTYPMKVFVLERLITLLLVMKSMKAKPCVDMRTIPRDWGGTTKMVGELLILDALKGQFLETGQPAFLDHYLGLRSHLLKTLSKPEIDIRKSQKSNFS